MPAKAIISTKSAFNSDLKPIFKKHPELFSFGKEGAGDFILVSFILYELGKGDKSWWKPYFDTWPDDNELHMWWDDDEQDLLQDKTLVYDSNQWYDTYMETWERLYKVLKLYPEFFSESSISMYSYKKVFTMTTNRCFGSWTHVHCMVPFAEFINHENVHVSYDCLDTSGKSIVDWEEDRKEKEGVANNFIRRG